MVLTETTTALNTSLPTPLSCKVQPEDELNSLFDPRTRLPPTPPADSFLLHIIPPSSPRFPIQVQPISPIAQDEPIIITIITPPSTPQETFNFPALPAVQTLPDPALTLISHYCNYNTKLALTRTCKNARNLLYAPMVKQTHPHRLKNVTVVMQRLLAAISLSILFIVTSLVCVATGFFAIILYFGNRYSNEHKTSDVVAVIVTTVGVFFLSILLCCFLIGLCRMHRWAVNQASECALALDTDFQKVRGRKGDKAGEKGGEDKNDKVFVNVEDWRVAKLALVEAKLRSLPWWWRFLVADV